jgi:hypothetical protein
MILFVLKNSSIYSTMDDCFTVLLLHIALLYLNGTPCGMKCLRMSNLPGMILSGNEICSNSRSFTGIRQSHEPESKFLKTDHDIVLLTTIVAKLHHGRGA